MCNDREGVMQFKTEADACIWEAVKLILETHDIEKVSIDNKYSSFIPVGFYLVPKEIKDPEQCTSP